MKQTPTDRLLKPEVLARIPLLAELAPDELGDLATHMQVQRFGKGEYVVQKGSAGDVLMFLLAGCLQVVNYTGDGKEIGLNLLTPGSFFGELALIDGLPRSASIVVIEPAAVAYLARDQALGLIYGKPALAERMLKHFAGAVRNLTSYRELLAIPHAHQRLYALLCQLKTQARDGEDVVANLPTQQQIAIMINTSRETVSRTLTELQQKGVLKKGQKTLYIIDTRVLERLAAGQMPERIPPE